MIVETKNKGLTAINFDEEERNMKILAISSRISQLMALNIIFNTNNSSWIFSEIRYNNYC